MKWRPDKLILNLTRRNPLPAMKSRTSQNHRSRGKFPLRNSLILNLSQVLLTRLQKRSEWAMCGAKVFIQSLFSYVHPSTCLFYPNHHSPSPSGSNQSRSYLANLQMQSMGNINSFLSSLSWLNHFLSSLMLRSNAGGWTICYQLLRECCSHPLYPKGFEYSQPSAYNHFFFFFFWHFRYQWHWPASVDDLYCALRSTIWYWTG